MNSAPPTTKLRNRARGDDRKCITDAKDGWEKPTPKKDLNTRARTSSSFIYPYTHFPSLSPRISGTIRREFGMSFTVDSEGTSIYLILNEI